MKPDSAVSSEVTAFADLDRYNDTKIFVLCVGMCMRVQVPPKAVREGQAPGAVSQTVVNGCVDSEDQIWVP